MHFSFRRIVAASLLGVIVISAGPASGEYPDRPIRLLTTGVGGNGDVTARLVAQGLTPRLGQQVIVDNRPSGFMSSEIAAKAQPDGHTLLVLGSTLWMSHLVQRVPYDAIRDFAPISLITRTPNVLIVSPSVPVGSVADLIALARLKPGVLNYGASGVGSSNNLAALLFKYMAKVDLVHVAYKSSSVLMIDLMSGQIQVAFPTGAAAAPVVKTGKVKALAVTTAQPSPSFPGVPTVSASGLPGYESDSPIGVLAPAGTPAGVIRRLHAELVQALKDPAIKERLFSTGAETVGNTPAEFAAKIKSEVARMGKVIKAAGIRVE